MKTKMKQSITAVQVGDNIYKIEKAVNLLIPLKNISASELQGYMDKGVTVTIGRVR